MQTRFSFKIQNQISMNIQIYDFHFQRKNENYTTVGWKFKECVLDKGCMVTSNVKKFPNINVTFCKLIY